ncbi:hypothetical protein T4E_8981 [Trichinella pseudospiralis]|uniref:Uncharacterized protein n=3 Tax=Trichinella pseudospiralis TaxID=6337 RepID=A0A0V0Y5W6_TRIPS|nr:hypothetical protein T4E_8981 [Trichinella pseudospiralis]
MPKLKKGATPSELVKGVTAIRMLTIGRKTEPASTGATARRLSRGKSPLKGRGARGGAGAVEPGLTLLLIPWRGSSKAAGLWYRNRVRKRDTISASSGIHVGRDPLLSGECSFCLLVFPVEDW